MPFEKFESPFENVELLGSRDLFCGEKLVLDLVEYQQGERVGADPMAPRASEPSYRLDASRTWRITFERPFAVKVRNQSLQSREPKINLPGRCCVAEQSEWLVKFVFDRRPDSLTMIHYVFDLIDNFVEIIGNDCPNIEELPDDSFEEVTG